MTMAITVPEEIAIIRKQWVESKDLELSKAKEALEQLRESGASDRRIQRVQERVALLRKVVRALHEGFIPIPRFSGETLRLDQENLPLKAIVAVNQAKAKQLFDEFLLVEGRQGFWQRGYRQTRARDPLVVGVVKTANIFEMGETDWKRNPVMGSREEHFLVAWWRPEDEQDEGMF